MEEAAVVLVGLVIVVAALSALASRIGVPYPIVLVIGGLVLGFVPGVPRIELDPELVFILFLPPLLYFAAIESTVRDLRADLRPITFLAFGLVLLTIVVVALVARALVPEMPWAVALALGAIVSPTDPIAATTIMQRLGVPRRLRTIVEGESLLNDTAAIILVRAAVAAAVGQGFTWWGVSLELALSAIGGIAIGLAVSWLLAQVRGRLNDKPVEILLSLVTAWAAYLPADLVGASGVLAVVSAGLLTSWLSPSIVTSAQTRLSTLSVWASLNFLGNAILFMVLGLQLPIVLDSLDPGDFDDYLRFALVVVAAVIGLRLLWTFTVPYLVRVLDRRPAKRERRIGWQERAVAGWSGMRGAVSLAAALSIPEQTDEGEEFPYRSLLIFVAFVVVLVTLVVQGLTLPMVISRLGVHDDGSDQREEVEARRRSADAAIARLDELAQEDWTRDDTIERMKGVYEFRRRRFAARAGEEPDDVDGQRIDDRSRSYQRVVREVIDAERRTLVELRSQGVISNAVMQRVERDLDLEDSRLEI